MADVYTSGQSNIGNLLRLIQEDKNQTPAAQVPAADPNSPIRGVIQQPIQSPQSPGSAQVVSLRPEGVTQTGPQAGPQGANVVAAAQAPMPVGAPGGSVSPVAVANFSRPAGPSVSSSPAPSTPFIGTRISSPAPRAKAAPTQVLGTSKSVSRPSSLVPKTTTPSTSKQGGLAGAIGSIAGGASSSLSGISNFLTGLGVALPPLIVPKNIIPFFNAGTSKPKKA